MLTKAYVGSCELTHWPAVVLFVHGPALLQLREQNLWVAPASSASQRSWECTCLTDPQLPSFSLELALKVSFLIIQLLERGIESGTFIINSKFQEPCWEFGKGILSGESLESSQDGVPNIGPPLPLQLWLDIGFLTQSPSPSSPSRFFFQTVGLGC